MKDVKRGDIVYINLGTHPKSSVMSGFRPCVVVSNDTSNRYSTIVNVCPLSSRIGKRYNPVHAYISSTDVSGYLEKDSLFLAEQILTVSKHKLVSKIGHVDENSEIMKQIESVLLKQLGIKN